MWPSSLCNRRLLNPVDPGECLQLDVLGVTPGALVSKGIVHVVGNASDLDHFEHGRQASAMGAACPTASRSIWHKAEPCSGWGRKCSDLGRWVAAQYGSSGCWFDDVGVGWWSWWCAG